ncbi:MAG: hypothetical protein JRN20_04935 [Nitrososphaerota archaeon]|nr:hypothetical protein [Nitrososphaerota archaeon]MDG6923179.1 hypothetical protein [Nitrososphaerota archaeon]
MEDLAGKYTAKAGFGKLDVDENSIISDTFDADNIKQSPSLDWADLSIVWRGSYEN